MDAAELERRLLRMATETAAGRNIKRNLELERFLPLADKNHLLEAVHDSPSDQPFDLLDAYKGACHRRALRGGAIRSRVGNHQFGRAIERDALIAFLWQFHAGRFPDAARATAFVNRLVKGRLRSSERLLVMSEFASWVTWDPDDPAEDPFSFFVASPEEVRACLGLSPAYRCAEGLILFRYSIPSSTVVHRPTVGDAALYEYFEPPPVGHDDHGLSSPWKEGMAELPSYEPEPRPEAVHPPVVFAQLRLPADEVK